MPFADISQHSSQTVIESGVGLGSVIAVTCSWTRNRSIFWAIVAGVFSWLYVCYFAFTRRDNEMPR
jgi:CHASE2 domain-containing sensor protein